MHRHPLLQQLAAYHAGEPAERALSKRLANFVESHSDCFDRALMTGHITASAWLVNQAGTHVLLTHHRKLDKWLQLGGHVDGHPDVLAAALREAYEESASPTSSPCPLPSSISIST